MYSSMDKVIVPYPFYKILWGGNNEESSDNEFTWMKIVNINCEINNKVTDKYMAKKHKTVYFLNENTPT